MGCASRVIHLRAGPVVMPSHTVGRHAHQLVATGYHSLGSASPTVSRSGRRIASALQSRGGNRGILGGTGETPPGVSGRRTLSGSPRIVVLSCRPFVYPPSRKGPLQTMAYALAASLKALTYVWIGSECHSERPVQCIASRRHLDTWDGQRPNMSQLIKRTPQKFPVN